MVVDFASLFAGNRNAWFDSETRTCIRRPVTVDTYRDHLERRGIGIYPVLGNRSCYWGAFDIDTDDLPAARKLAAILADFDVTAWIERSRSKGYHVWVFAEQAVGADMMRDALRFVDRVAETECPEINPKGNRGLVNCVRLPYDVAANENRMEIIDEDDRRIELADFVEAAMALRTSRRAVHLLAGYQVAHETRRVQARLVEGAGKRRSKGGGRSSQDAARLYRGEIRATVGSRDASFFTLAHYLTNGLGLDATTARAEVERVWHEQCDDPDSFTLDDALKKLDRV